MRLFLTALLAAIFAAGSAVADDSALNKEGRWTVGRGDADSKVCLASIGGGDVPMLVLQDGVDGVGVALGTKTRMKPGKQGVLIVGDQRFDFKPEYTEERTVMFADGVGAPALTALRKARWVSVTVDGRELTSIDLDKSGADGAIDAMLACAKGESGWWGPGIGTPQVASTETGAETPLHKDGFWFMEPLEGDTGICMATAKVEDGFAFSVIVGHPNVMSFGVTSGEDMRRARKGEMKTDAYTAAFKPAYEGKTYLYPAEDLDSQAAFALRRAKTVVITVDGKPLVDMDFDGTGYPDVLLDLADCAAGKTGWWGEGAKPSR